jgi:hypothetical protein
MHNSDIVTHPTVTDNIVAAFLMLAILALAVAVMYVLRRANHGSNAPSPLQQAATSHDRRLALDEYIPAPPPRTYCGAKLPTGDDDTWSRARS